jgi:CobQ-like glutamine amidotransferase family enzyme
VTSRASRPSALRIVSLFPDLLGTYGDSGNVLILAQRAHWRGFAVEVVKVSAGGVVPASGDVYVIGGGEDGSQVAAVAALRSPNGVASSLSTALLAGAQLLAVCAGLQILGEWFVDADGARTSGLGLLDLRTTRLVRRAVGEVVADPDPSLGLPTLSGFENHGGHTVLGPTTRPLARVRHGTGNGPPEPGTFRAEGVVSDSTVGTYLHGPVLARNPGLADLLIGRAVGTAAADLAPIHIAEHAALRRRVLVDT